MSERIICGYKPASIGSNPARWPRGTTIRYRVAVPQLNGLTRYAFRSAFRWACDRWQDVCGIMFEEVNSRENLTVTIMGGRPGGVLAQAELPYLEGRRTPLMMQFDASERWGADVNAAGTPVNLVALHELGHTLGLDHGGRGIMRPTLDTSAASIDDWERGLVVEAYGPPRMIPAPQPPVDPQAEAELFRLVQRAGGVVLLVRDGVTVERMGTR